MKKSSRDYPLAATTFDPPDKKVTPRDSFAPSPSPFSMEKRLELMKQASAKKSQEREAVVKSTSSKYEKNPSYNYSDANKRQKERMNEATRLESEGRVSQADSLRKIQSVKSEMKDTRKRFEESYKKPATKENPYPIKSRSALRDSVISTNAPGTSKKEIRRQVKDIAGRTRVGEALSDVKSGAKKCYKAVTGSKGKGFKAVAKQISCSKNDYEF